MKNLCKKLFLYAICAVSFNANAQDISNQVIAVAGGSGEFADGSFLFFTVGEPIINTTAIAGNAQLTQGFHQNQYANTLPVELTNLTISAESDYHLVKWTTSSELNNDYFIVEYSVNGTDFTSLKSVHSKAPNGNSSVALYYSYTNYKVKNGNNYYRLKQVDKDGKWKYSNIVELDGNGKVQNIIALYPNPVKQDATLTIAGNIGKDAKAKIINISGQTVKTAVVNSLNTPIYLEELKAGTYVLQYEDGANKKTIKFIKL